MTEQLDLFSIKGNGHMKLRFCSKENFNRFTLNIPETDDQEKIKRIAEKEVKRVKALRAKQPYRTHFRKITYVTFNGKRIKL